MPDTTPFSSDAGRWREVLDAAPDAMILVDEQQRLIFVNKQAETMFGFSREELIGERLTRLIPARVHHVHDHHVSSFFERSVVRPMGGGIELYAVRKDGSEFPVEVSLSPIKLAAGKAVAAAVRDVTETRRIERLVRLQGERLAAAVENMQDAFALFDAELALVLCNSAYRGLLADAKQGQLLGESLEVLFEAFMRELVFASEDERNRCRELWLSRAKEPKLSCDVTTKDGRKLRVMGRRTPEGGLVKTIWDLTDELRVQEELKAAQARAESASAAKSEFLSSMSHELRTPLNAILGFAELLARDKKEPLSSRHKERVGQILKGGEHLLRLIDDVLDLARIEAGRLAVSTEPAALDLVLEEVRAALSPWASASGLELSVAPLGELPLVLVDRTRLIQILMNFGSNAIKYNKKGGAVRFEVERPSEGLLRVSAVDTGIGIAAHNHEKLFQAFQRAGQETGPIEGTGIGLLITKRLAELMGGTVGFSSELGLGSRFWVDVPVHIGPARRLEGSEREAMGERLAGAVKRVLYVEDNPANVSLMRDVLSSFDQVTLDVAPTAEIGLEMAKSRPDIIILDINLPGMSGLDAIKALRADARTASIPVIALTAAASERDKARGLAAGFRSYLTKPVRIAELIATLEALLELPEA